MQAVLHNFVDLSLKMNYYTVLDFDDLFSRRPRQCELRGSFLLNVLENRTKPSPAIAEVKI